MLVWGTSLLEAELAVSPGVPFKQCRIFLFLPFGAQSPCKSRESATARIQIEWRIDLIPKCFGNETVTKSVPAANVRLKRAYDPAEAADGTRVLVDRLWPRGVSKSDADLDQWMKDIAPSTELRKWFAHDPARWEEFCRRYRDELNQNDELLSQLRSLARNSAVTLVYSAHDEIHNDAVVLREVILDRWIDHTPDQ
jgi:uncharacterized protein YeaO (DUF488 family)